MMLNLKDNLRRRREPSVSKRVAHPLTVLNLSGTQEEMGTQHGDLLRLVGGFESVTGYYPRLVERMLRGSQVDPLSRALPTLARPAIAAALRMLESRRPQDLRARSRAFAVALNGDPSQSRYTNVMDVLQNLVGIAGQHPWGPVPQTMAAAGPAACSTLAAWGDATEGGRLLHARNFDFPGASIWDRAPTVVFCNPTQGLRYGFATTKGADTPGVTAFNEAGLSITVHTRFHHNVSFWGRSLVDAAHDIIRNAATLQEAIELAASWQWASTWGLLVSSATERRAVLIEVNARKMSVVEPRTGDPFLVSTNRYLSSALKDGEVEPVPGWAWHAEGRLGAMINRARGAQKGEGLTVADLEDLMGSHEDPEVDGWERAAGGVLAQAMGVQTVVIDAESAAISVSAGDAPTGKGPYVRVPWRWTQRPESQVVQPVLGQRGGFSVSDARTSSRFDSGVPARAFAAYCEASRLEAIGAPWAEVETSLEEAAALDPEEPSYQLLAAGCHLRRGDLSGAARAFKRGIETERSPFPLGRLLFWDARTADARGDLKHSRKQRRRLEEMDHPLLVKHKERAQVDSQRPMSRLALRHTPVHVQMCDLG